MTCDCGYSTPATGRDGRPLSDAMTQFLFRRHRCAPRDRHGDIITEALCGDCGQVRQVHTPGARCLQCAYRERAARQAELDDIAVERLLAGSPVAATRAERQAAVAYLTGHGLSARAIAERTGMSSRTAQRLRSRAS